MVKNLFIVATTATELSFYLVCLMWRLISMVGCELKGRLWRSHGLILLFVYRIDRWWNAACFHYSSSRF